MQTTWPYPRFIAHRGGGVLAPENTLAAMRTAVAHGYAMVEYDVKLSADGVPVLLHDDTLTRTTNGTGPVALLPYASLALLDAGHWYGPAFAGEPVPSLTAIARYTRACEVASNIEIKPCPGRAYETGVQTAHTALDLWGDSSLLPLLSSFSDTALAGAAQAAPGLPRALLVGHQTTPGWLARARQLGCVAVHLDDAMVSRQTVTEIHKAGLRLAVWTVNEPARARTLFDWHVDAIITDALDRIDPRGGPDGVT